MSETVASPARVAFKTMISYLEGYISNVGARSPEKRFLTIIVADDSYGTISDGNLKAPPAVNIPNPHFDEMAIAGGGI